MNKLNNLLGKVKNVITQYPTVLTIAFLLGILQSYLVDLKGDEGYEIVKFCLTLALGISLFYGIKMLSQRIGKLILLQLVGLIILLLFYFLLPSESKDMNEIAMFWILPCFIVSHLFVAFAPYITINNENKFWEYNKNLFINFILTILFSGVLISGIELAILAVENLFSLSIDGDIYPKTFLFLATFGSCFIFLTFNENGLSYLEKQTTYPIVLKFFTQFILIPLLLVYIVILYVYCAKILINWELPRGWVSYLILAYSIVGTLALLLVHPLKELKIKSWVKIFSKAFYYTIIPLIVLLYVAIFTRILEYGYTELRYFVLLAAIWLTSNVIYFVFYKKASIKFIPVSLFCFLVFAISVPHFNIFSVAKRSQKKELKEIFNANQLIENGQLNFKKRITSETKKEIGNKINFLYQRDELDFIYGYLNPSLQKEIDEIGNHSYKIKYLITDHFSNVETSKDEPTNKTITLRSTNDMYEITGYDYYHEFSHNYQKSEILSIDGDQFVFEFDRAFSDQKFELSFNNKEAVDLIPEFDKLFTKYSFTIDQEYRDQDVPEIAFEVEVENYRIKFIFENLSYHQNKHGVTYYDFYNATLLFKKK